MDKVLGGISGSRGYPCAALFGAGLLRLSSALRHFSCVASRMFGADRYLSGCCRHDGAALREAAHTQLALRDTTHDRDDDLDDGGRRV